MYFKKSVGLLAGVLCKNGLKSINGKFLEIAKSEDSENTTHVDFGRFLAILEHATQKSQ